MRFVRILKDPDPKSPGSRIRIDYDPDDTGAFGIMDENVLPEKVYDPNCIRVVQLAFISLTRDIAGLLRDALTELCDHIDAEKP